jgi:hypothetical protein
VAGSGGGSGGGFPLPNASSTARLMLGEGGRGRVVLRVTGDVRLLQATVLRYGSVDRLHAIQSINE